MRSYLFLLASLIVLLTGCDEPAVEKPQHLVKRDKMISVLVDIHLAEAVYQTKRFTTEELNKYSESDFYYSVLKKHHLSDSVFEKSVIYYSSKPKELEKIYTRVINQLTEMEQKLNEKAQQPVDVNTTPQ
jgi:hypothetical protein